MRFVKGDFITVPNKNALKSISPNAQALFMWICVYADEEGLCYPSRSTLAVNLNSSVRTVDTYLKELEDNGFISKTKRFNKREQQSNLYQILIKEGGANFALPRAESALPPVQTLRTELNPIELNPINLVEASSTEPLVVVSEDDSPKREKKPRKVTEKARAVFDLFGKDCYLMLGIRKQEVEAAVFLSEKFSIETLKSAVSYIKEHEDSEMFYSVHSPYDLRVKWSKLKAHKAKHN